MMASMAYSTWNSRPSGENVFTPAAGEGGHASSCSQAGEYCPRSPRSLLHVSARTSIILAARQEHGCVGQRLIVTADRHSRSLSVLLRAWYCKRGASRSSRRILAVPQQVPASSGRDGSCLTRPRPRRAQGKGGGVHASPQALPASGKLSHAFGYRVGRNASIPSPFQLAAQLSVPPPAAAPRCPRACARTPAAAQAPES